jgi:hypothetical protein
VSKKPSLLVGGLLAAAVLALPVAGSTGGAPAEAPAALAFPPQTPAGLAAGDPSAPALFYAVPDDRFADGENQIRVEVRVDGEPFIEERFAVHTDAIARVREQSAGRSRRTTDAAEAGGGSRVVFELLAERPEMRAHLHELAAAGGRLVEVEVQVNGRSAAGGTLDELAAAGGELLAAAGPPVAVAAGAQAFAAAAVADPPSSFYVCGDDSCGGGTPPIGENCESCPEDCGGPCSICGNNFCGGTETCSTCATDCGTCPPCPQSLGFETRCQLLNVYYYINQCRDGAFGRAYYTDTDYYYKCWRVERIRQCNGSITESVVPGSTTYHWGSCWQYTGPSCSFSWGSAFPTC